MKMKEHASRGLPRAARPALALTLVVGVASLAACGTSPAGPLQSLTEQGRVVVTTGSSPVLPGQDADATVWVFNNSASDPVTLVSASPVPISGERAGRQTHVAVVSKLNPVDPGHGWPPGVDVWPFAGASLAHGQNDIEFAITGRQVGENYMAAGLRITYRYKGQLFTMTAWSADVACIVSSTGPKSYPSCKVANDRAQAKTEKLAGVTS
jgi:hypothetical protein